VSKEFFMVVPPMIASFQRCARHRTASALNAARFQVFAYRRLRLSVLEWRLRHVAVFGTVLRKQLA
jgi:hypothetical protein